MSFTLSFTVLHTSAHGMDLMSELGEAEAPLSPVLPVPVPVRGGGAGVPLLVGGRCICMLVVLLRCR